MGRAVRGAIVQAGLNNEQAAELAGFSTRTLSRRINGDLPFTWPEIVSLADVLDTTALELATVAERLAAKKEPAA
jgi:plasmid maintenance system antidote protein VapI